MYVSRICEVFEHWKDPSGTSFLVSVFSEKWSKLGWDFDSIHPHGQMNLKTEAETQDTVAY